MNGIAEVSKPTGSLTMISRRSGVTGRSTPAISPMSPDQAPAAHTTCEHVIVPCVVSTEVILRLPLSPRVTMPVTSQHLSTVTPRSRAAVM